ncbi:MAG: hypothetical protein KJZ73_02500 [Pseudorhodoplanes sp.]|nr:hypothetical protein [Pseudorhodoplanes sp.]
MSGALFCHDAKRASTRTGEIELNRGVADRHITIRPDPRLGQPGPLAHKVFVALIKKHSGYGRPVPKEISFTRREIGRLIGRKEWGGKDSEQLSRALHEIHYTFIKSHFKRADGKFVEHSFNVFPEIRIERREFASDPIEACTITLAEPILDSLRDEHFTCLNHVLMSQLGTIGQALYMRLFFHFANLYDGRNGRHLAFPKRYDDICSEWLGGLTVLQHRSKIFGEQLGPHLDRLVATGFLASYGIDKAKTRAGFVVILRPGKTFFEDYARFYQQRRQGGRQVEFHGERREVAEPLRVAYLFAEKRTGQPVASIAFVPSKDVETAKQFLAELPFAEMERFIAYGLAEAARSNFDVQTLGGLKQYLAPYLRRKAHATAQAAGTRQAAQAEDQHERYAAYTARRASEAVQRFNQLPADQQADIRASATARAAGFPGTLRNRMFDFHLARITAERTGQPIESFEDWKADVAV